MNETIVETLARWYGTLNYWEWPEDMPGKPEGFDELPNYPVGPRVHEMSEADTKVPIVTARCEAIELLIGLKECKRWRQIHQVGRTPEEFEEWWTKYYEKGG